MSVKKNPSNSRRPWTADYRNANGIRKRKSFATKREANEFLAEAQQASKSSGAIDPAAAQRTTVDMLWPKYHERLSTVGTKGRGPVGPRTLADYEHSWSAHVQPRWGMVPLASIREEDVRLWVETMPAKRGGGIAGARPRAEAAKLLRRVLDHAVRLKYIDHNPALDQLGHQEGLPSSKRKTEHQPLTMSQLRRLAEASGEWEALILLAGTSGPRWGELSALKGADLIPGEKPKLRIQRAWTNVRGHLVMGKPKSGKPRTVPVLPSVAKMLPERDPFAWMWTGTRGGVLRSGWFREKVLEPAVAQCQQEDPTFPSIVLHDLRHTAVSNAIASGANIKVVQRLAGHAHAKLTLDTYGEMFDRDLLEMAGAIEDAFKAA